MTSRHGSTLAAAILLAIASQARAADLEPAPPLVGQKSQVLTDVEFTLTADWQVGESYRIEYSKERTVVRDGKVTSGRGWATIDARVEEKTSEGYVIAWTTVDGGLENYAQGAGTKQREIETLLIEISKGARQEIRTNIAGVPVGLRNLDEVVTHFEAMLRGILETAPHADPQMEAKIWAVMRQVLTPQAIEAGAITDAQYVYGLMGGTYRGGEVAAYEMELPFPLSGEAIPATLHVLLREIDEEDGLIRIATQSIPDPDGMRRAMVAWMARVAQAQGLQPPEPSQAPRLFVQDTSEFVYDPATGLPREIKAEKFIRAGGDSSLRIDRRTIKISPMN